MRLQKLIIMCTSIGTSFSLIFAVSGRFRRAGFPLNVHNDRFMRFLTGACCNRRVRFLLIFLNSMGPCYNFPRSTFLIFMLNCQRSTAWNFLSVRGWRFWLKIVCVLYSLKLRVDVGQHLRNLGIVLASVRPFYSSIANDHSTIAFTRIMVTNFNRSIFVFTATPVWSDREIKFCFIYFLLKVAYFLVPSI